MKQPASHPWTCQRCNGTGWQPGAPILTVIAGKPHTYDTVQPCDHHWWDDDPSLDGYGLDQTQPIEFEDYMRRLMERIRRGDPNAIAELDGWEHATHMFGGQP